MLKAAVVLSGCGYMDGAEINEAVFTLLSLSLENVAYQCFAPNIKQHHVTNHFTGEQTSETRNVLQESARIARGDIKDLANVDAAEFDAVFFPGGYGAIANLADFIDKGTQMSVNADVLRFAKQFVAAGKPIGVICIAPVLATQFFDDAKVTIGEDAGVAEKIVAMGGQHVASVATEIVIDKANNLVSTPAFMMSTNLSEVFAGISECVEKVIQLARRSKRMAA